MAIDVYKNISSSSGTNTATGSGNFDPTSTDSWFEEFDDFITPLSNSASGLSIAASSASVTEITTTDGNRPGQIRYAIQQTNDAASIRSIPTKSYRLGALKLKVAAAIKINDLSDGTDNYLIRMGVDDSSLAKTIIDGVYIIYDRDTYGDQNWRAVTKDGGTATTVDTGIAATADWVNIRVEITDSSEAKFYVDGVLGATITTNIPTSATLNYTIMTRKTASGGTPAQILNEVDWAYFAHQPTTDRGTF